MYELVNKYTQYPTLALSKGLLIILGTTGKKELCNLKLAMSNFNDLMQFTLYNSQTLVENRTNTVFHTFSTGLAFDIFCLSKDYTPLHFRD